jgi:hypothetical protein
MYAAFLFLDLTGGSTTISSYIKFMVIILCFCYALFAKRRADKSILFLMKAGLFFTVISDLLILILDVYFYGVLTFIIVQQVYGIRISMENFILQREATSKRIWSSFVRRVLLQLVVSFTICSLLALSSVELEPLLMASVFYFISIVMNTFVSVKTALTYPNSRRVRMFALGMFLFLLCDINVGLFNLSGFIAMPQSTYSDIYGISSILMWTFYAPSQVILALSTRSPIK